MPRSAAELLWFEGPAALLRSGQGGRWERGVALGALGRYADARALLEPLATSLALSTLASHARQVGRHADDLDLQALELAATPAERADATSGLVADALGRGDAGLAHDRLVEARAAVHDWRSGVRCRWVAAELALLEDRAAAAVADADVAVELAAGAPRHLAKSWLVRGVARHVASHEGASDLLAALEAARELGLVTLVWPAAQVAAEALPARARELRALAGRAVAEVVEGLGEQGRSFAARPDIAALLQHAAVAR